MSYLRFYIRKSTRLMTYCLMAAFYMQSCTTAAEHEIAFHVHAGEYALINAPVYVELENSGLEGHTSIFLEARHEQVPGQIELLDDMTVRVWWIVNLDAGEAATYGLVVVNEHEAPQFRSERIGMNSTRVLYNGRPVLQYEHPEYDPGDIENTRKPFHHIFDPAGDNLITKGPGGQYTHHQGIFFGYNHVYINDSRVNIWFSNEGERSEHMEFIREFEGPVMGGHEARIYWKDLNGKPFLEERRDVRAFRSPGDEIIIEFNATLHTMDGPVRLDGDRQHAGVQFRAAQYVADNPENTRFIRPDDRSDVGPRQEIPEEHMLDMGWNAMHFILEGNPVTVAYLSHPENPQGAEMSERLYGRFGEFFPWYVTDDNPLNVSYRFWITSGSAPSVDDIYLRYRAFANPPNIVKDK